MNIFDVQGVVFLLILVALLLIKGFAFVSALSFPAPAYEATGKLTKPAWVAITGLGFAAQLIMIASSPLHLLHLVFTIASLVFLADVLPALREVAPRSGRFSR